MFLPELHSDADIPSSAQMIQRDDSWVAPTRLHTPICESRPCRRKRAGKGSPGKRVFGKAQTMGRGGQQSAVRPTAPDQGLGVGQDRELATVVRSRGPTGQWAGLRKVWVV